MATPNGVTDAAEVYKRYTIPNTYEEALTLPEAEHWKRAVEAEMQSCRDYETWKEVTMDEAKKRHPGTRIVGSRLVFKIVFGEDGSIVKYKARLTVQGYSQVEGVNFFDVYSSIPRQSTFKLVLAAAVELNMSLTSYDIGSAFLESDSDAIIVMRFPPGLRRYNKHGKELVAILMKNLYGLKQGPRCFGKRFAEFQRKCRIDGMQLEQSKRDPTLWVLKRPRPHWRGGDDDPNRFEAIGYVIHWVDDVLAAFVHESHRRQYAALFKAEWRRTTDGEDASWYLKCGIKYDRSAGILDLQQTQMIEKLMLLVLRKLECDEVESPAVVGQKLYPTEEGCELAPEDAQIFRSAVGVCMWLYCLTRYDIGFALVQLCRFVSNPSKQHFKALRRLVCWLGNTRHIGLRFTRNGTNDCVHGAGTPPLTLSAASDCGFAANHDLTSNGAYMVLLGGSPIAVKVWVLKFHLWSSHEGETVVASECTREVVHQRGLCEDMAITQQGPTDLYVDNEQTFIHAQEVRLTDKSKHIRLRDWYVRERHMEGDIRVLKAKGSDLVIDCLTKQLPIPQHNRHFPRVLGHVRLPKT